METDRKQRFGPVPDRNKGLSPVTKITSGLRYGSGTLCIVASPPRNGHTKSKYAEPVHGGEGVDWEGNRCGSVLSKATMNWPKQELDVK